MRTKPREHRETTTVGRDPTMHRLARTADPRGQVLVIVGIAMVALIAMVGLVIDGGYAWGRQRDTQNGADAVSKAGTVVVQHWLAQDTTPTPTDWDVACAAEEAAAVNQVVLESAEYVDFEGESLGPAFMVGTCGLSDPGVPIPDGAQGIRAETSETFSPFLMQVVGFDTLTATANATAVVGTPQGIPGGSLPITFPLTFNLCDNSAASYTIGYVDPNPPHEWDFDDGDTTWEPYEILRDETLASSSNMAIVPLCDIDSGSVGWLDFACDQTLKEAIDQPCEKFIYIPDWIHTQTGNVNALEDNINAYVGNTPGTPEGELFPDNDSTDAVLAMPIHQNTCENDPNAADSDPAAHTETCPTGEWSGQGDNLFYDVHFWVGFKIDQAYTGGGDVECRQAPGQPQLVNPVPAGKVGCLKGWFVRYIPEPGPIALGPISPGDDVDMRVELIN